MPMGCASGPHIALVGLNRVDHPVLPPRGSPIGVSIENPSLREYQPNPRPAERLHGDLAQDVGKIMNGVDHPSDVGRLDASTLESRGRT